MDDLTASLPQLGIILALAVSGTVFLIQKIKMLVAKHSKRKIPAWFWLGVSIVIPFAIVLVMLQPWAQSWLNTILPSSMQLAVSPSDVLATGASAVIGSGGAYAAAKKFGLAADYSAGANNADSLPTPEVPMEPRTPIVPAVVAESPVAAPEADIPAPQSAAAPVAFTARLLYDENRMPAYVELTQNDTGKRRVLPLWRSDIIESSGPALYPLLRTGGAR